jgi:hypothetical protein
MNAIIETRHASLDTFAVTINALHVNGKQMTLAVFRQLPFSELPIDEISESSWWGVVNYPCRDAEEITRTCWLVYDDTGRLFRYALDGRSYQQVARMEVENAINGLASWREALKREQREWGTPDLERIAMCNQEIASFEELVNAGRGTLDRARACDALAVRASGFRQLFIAC